MADNTQKKDSAAEELSSDVAESLSMLSPAERAAVILLLLGEDQAAEIIKYMSPREVQSLGATMVSVSDLSQEAVNTVLDDFVDTIKKQTNIGLGARDYVSNTFIKALGDDKAASVLGRIMPGSTSKGLDVLQWMDARSIGEMVQEEHPQIIAIVLSVLEYDIAADVLNYLPENLRPEVVYRIAALETVHPNAMNKLEAVIQKQFSSSSSAKASSFGGIKAAAKIMNFTKTDLEGAILNGVSIIDEEMTNQIMDNMFTFENFDGLDNRSVQTLMRNVDSDLLMTALKGGAETVKEKFLSNMSQRARLMFLDDMEDKGPIRISDVEEAQKDILRIARRLSDAGEIVLAGRGDDFV